MPRRLPCFPHPPRHAGPGRYVRPSPNHPSGLPCERRARAMSNEAAVATFQLELPVPRPGRWRRFIPAVENLLVSLALGAMMVIPLAEIILRRTLHTGIQGATPIVEHLTLIVGMLGGAIAARDNRLLSLSHVGGRLQGRFQVAGRMVAMAVAAAVTASLAIAATQFVVEEKGAGAVLAYGMPIWVVEMCLPVGFGLITAYLVWHAGENWRGRLAASALAGVVILFAARSPISPGRLVWPFLFALLVATLLGIPVFVTLGGIALILFWGIGQPIGSITIDHYSLVTSPSLPTIPLFTLAGYFLAESRAPQRLVRVFHAIFTRLRGGSILVTVLVCAFFTTFTGASRLTLGSQVGTPPAGGGHGRAFQRLGDARGGLGGDGALRLPHRNRHPPRPETLSRRSARYDRVRAAGGRRASDSGRGAGVHELSGGCGSHSARHPVDDHHNSLAAGVSASAERVPAYRRLPDGHLLGHRHSGAAARSAGLG